MTSYELTGPSLLARITGQDGNHLRYRDFVSLTESLPKVTGSKDMIIPMRESLDQMLEQPKRDMDHIRATVVALSKMEDTKTAPKLLKLMEEEKDTFFAAEYVWCLSNIGEQPFREGVKTYLTLRGKAREEQEEQLHLSHTNNVNQTQQALMPQYPHLISFYTEGHPVAATEVMLDFLGQENYSNPWPIPDELVGILGLDNFQEYFGRGYETKTKHPIISRVTEFMKESKLDTNHPGFRGAAYVLVQAFQIKKDVDLVKQELDSKGKEALDKEYSIFWGGLK